MRRYRHLLLSACALPLLFHSCGGPSTGTPFLESGSVVPIFLAVGSALLMSELVLTLFDRGECSLRLFIGIQLFTATIGIVLLLGIQWVAERSRTMVVSGDGTALWLFARVIDFAYRCTTDDNAPFLILLLGYVVGVGVCEELIKVAPVIWFGGELDWAGSCTAGLASGIGFGVAEGIYYCFTQYDGVCSGSIYVVRFISVVGFHAALTGAAALQVWRDPLGYDRQTNSYRMVLLLVVTILPSVFLHGIYDVYATREQPLGALIVYVGIFVWLFWQVEKARGFARPTFRLPKKQRTARPKPNPLLFIPPADSPPDGEYERILRKIDEEGITSLSSSEREVLQQFTRNTPNAAGPPRD